MTRKAVNVIDTVLTPCPPLVPRSPVYVGQCPPTDMNERVPVAPGSAHVWEPGYFRWTEERYVWTRGRWAVPPRGHHLWIAGHWASSARGYFWVPGHWR